MFVGQTPICIGGGGNLPPFLWPISHFLPYYFVLIHWPLCRRYITSCVGMSVRVNWDNVKQYLLNYNEKTYSRKCLLILNEWRKVYLIIKNKMCRLFSKDNFNSCCSHTLSNFSCALRVRVCMRMINDQRPMACVGLSQILLNQICDANPTKYPIIFNTDTYRAWWHSRISPER